MNDRRLNIAVFNELYPPDHLGGAERTAELLFKELSKKGHHVRVLTGYTRHPSREEGISRILPLYNDPAKRVDKLLWLKKLYYDVTSYSTAQSFFKAGDFSVLLARSVRYMSFRPITAALAIGIPVVFIVPDDWLARLKEGCDKSFVYGTLRKKFLYGGFDFSRVLCPSEYVLDAYVKAAFRRESLSVLPHGVDVDRFKPEERVAGPAPVKLIYVGRLFPAKGVHVLIEAAKVIREKGRDFRIDIIGKGQERYEEDLRKKIEEYGLGPKVILKGMVPQEDLPEHYRQADIAVAPSLKETFGITLIEAMSSGLPVVASGVEAIPENIEDGVDGMLVKPENPDVLAGAVISLMDDREKRLRMGRAAREKAVRDFSLQKFISKLEEILFSVSKR